MSRVQEDIRYDRALAAKWQSVARVAVDLLTKIAKDNDYYNGYQLDAKEALATIGPLPEKGE